MAGHKTGRAPASGAGATTTDESSSGRTRQRRREHRNHRRADDASYDVGAITSEKSAMNIKVHRESQPTVDDEEHDEEEANSRLPKRRSSKASTASGHSRVNGAVSVASDDHEAVEDGDERPSTEADDEPKHHHRKHRHKHHRKPRKQREVVEAASDSNDETNEENETNANDENASTSSKEASAVHAEEESEPEPTKRGERRARERKGQRRNGERRRRHKENSESRSKSQHRRKHRHNKRKHRRHHKKDKTKHSEESGDEAPATGTDALMASASMALNQLRMDAGRTLAQVFSGGSFGFFPKPPPNTRANSDVSAPPTPSASSDEKSDNASSDEDTVGTLENDDEVLKDVVEGKQHARKVHSNKHREHKRHSGGDKRHSEMRHSDKRHSRRKSTMSSASEKSVVQEKGEPSKKNSMGLVECLAPARNAQAAKAVAESQRLRSKSPPPPPPIATIAGGPQMSASERLKRAAAPFGLRMRLRRLPAAIQSTLVMGDESLMDRKEHGSCSQGAQSQLRYNVNPNQADKLCCYTRSFAEAKGFFWKKATFLEDMEHRVNETPIEFFDSVFGRRCFVAPVNRTFEDFVTESKHHGWPSFRDNEVDWRNVRVIAKGETVTLDGVHLGHNIPDSLGNRYCINLSCVAGEPAADTVVLGGLDKTYSV